MNRHLILAMCRPQLDLAVVPHHAACLDDRCAWSLLELVGPFDDPSGGACLLRAANLAEAMAVVHNDPAHLSGGWQLAAHEWQAK